MVAKSDGNDKVAAPSVSQTRPVCKSSSEGGQCMRHAIACWWALATCLAAPASARAESISLYVSPEGSDSWSGRLAEVNPARSDGPLATVGQAQKALRELRKEGRLAVPTTVYVRGVHRLREPLVFRSEDSGTPPAPITYTAYPNERPLLSGGRSIAGWRRGPGDVWTADLPEVKAGRWYFRQLFVNGRRACRARSPNQGFLRVQGLVDAKPGAEWNQGVDRFRFKPGEIQAYRDLGRVEAVVFHSWNTSRLRIASVDAAKAIVTFTGPTIFRPLAWDPNQRYYLENAGELLDAPGEWYLDRQTGVLSYWPLPGEDMAKAEAIAPLLGELVRFDGDPDAGKFVDQLRLVGLRLEHADWALPDQGYGDAQAAVTIPAVISAKGARHCLLERCEVAHVGTYGVWLGRGCKENRVVQNHLHDLGAGGVRIGEATMPPSDVTESTGNVVTNNYIHDGGHVYAGAVGLWLAQSSHNEISHNEIHSFDYSGISVGWNWDSSPNRTSHNRIQQNHVHHVVRGVLSDAGGIYTLGVQTGTVIRGNVFHDIFPYLGSPAMAWGIYFDSGSSGMLVEDNVVYHTLTGGIMNTAHPGNIVRNNVFALSAWQAAWRYSWVKEPPSVVECNIFYLTQGELFHTDGGSSDFRSRWDKNLYWRTDGLPLEFYGEPLENWQAKGPDRHSIVADPQFVDPSQGDFRLKPGSPAFALGIRSIDTSRNGLFGPAEWVALPRQSRFPATVLRGATWPPRAVPVDDGFEQTPVGQPPELAQLNEENRGDSIRVSDETAATGRHSLKFTDAAGLAHLFNPHVFHTPHFADGRARFSCNLRVEKGAVLAHEWRDAGQPYRTGPSLVIDGSGKLLANGRPLADVPLGTWFRIEIVCPLGRLANGTYDLAIIRPTQPAQRFASLSCSTPKFNRLEWLGFVSLASSKTVFYVDDVKLLLDRPGRP